MELVKTDGVLFLDADIKFWKDDTLLRSWELLNDGYGLVSCKLKGYDRDWKINFGFWVWNWVHKGLIKWYPFAVGGFFMTRTQHFAALGGWDERVDNSGDFLASQYFRPDEFKVLHHPVGQDGRRIRKIGWWGMVSHLIKNFWKFHQEGKSWFYKKSRYWG